jgi:hypothetical protein
MKLYFGGGLNEQESPLMIEAAAGSYNFDLDFQSYKYRPRHPFDLSGTTPNGKAVTGLMQLVKRSGSETTLVQANETIYKWNGASTFSAIGTCATSSHLRDTYWSLDDYIVVTDLDKATVVKKWDGTTFGTLTTGLGGTNLYAKYGAVYGGRVWLFNVTTTTDTPHICVASAFENPTSYDTTKRPADASFTLGTEAFYMTTPDLRAINGVALLFGTIIISTDQGRLYRLAGNDSRDYEWKEFFSGSNAIGEEGIVSIGNDIFYIGRDGRIDLLSATDKYGDVRADDMSRWIRTTASSVSEPICVYDQTNQKVLTFSTNGKVLAFHKDILAVGGLVNERGERQACSPWSVYTTDHSSGFSTEAAKFMRLPGTTEYTVYFGGPIGQVFNLNGSGDGDGGTKAISANRVFAPIYDDKFYKHSIRGSLYYRKSAPATFFIDADWIDELSVSTVQITLDGPSATDTGVYWGSDIYYSGGEYYNAGFEFSEKQTRQNFSHVGKGPGVTFSCYATSTSRWVVDYIEIK